MHYLARLLARPHVPISVVDLTNRGDHTNQSVLDEPARVAYASRVRELAAVRKAIKRAIDAVHATAPDLAALLDASVSTGYHCYYNPTAPATRER